MAAQLTTAQAWEWWRLAWRKSESLSNGGQIVLGESYASMDRTVSRRSSCYACGERLPVGLDVLAVNTSPHGGWTWTRRLMHLIPCLPEPEAK